MTVYDLNRDQLEQVKQFMLMQRYAESGESPAWGDLADVDNIISDEEVYDEYAGTEFTPDDFGGSDEPDDLQETTMEDKLLALEASVRMFAEHGYIPFTSPYPSSTEKQLADAVYKAAALLNQAAYCAHLLRH